MDNSLPGLYAWVIVVNNPMYQVPDKNLLHELEK